MKILPIIILSTLLTSASADIRYGDAVHHLQDWSQQNSQSQDQNNIAVQQSAQTAADMRAYREEERTGRMHAQENRW